MDTTLILIISLHLNILLAFLVLMSWIAPPGYKQTIQTLNQENEEMLQQIIKLTKERNKK